VSLGVPLWLEKGFARFSYGYEQINVIRRRGKLPVEPPGSRNAPNARPAAGGT
jgi:hypothetical protein